MSRLTYESLKNIVKRPLGRAIDQKAVERWASSLWKLPKQEELAGKSNLRPYVIMFPPPNITGTLHLGHALTGAIQDALVRQKRMLGYNCKFIPGFDHAGLATQGIVEKVLWKRDGITRQQLGRDKFIDMANQWKDSKRTEMRQQLDRLGLNLDHELEYFTMDDNSSLAVHAAFKQLFNSEVIYRSSKPIFWSETLQTTLSDIEVERGPDGIDRYIRTGEVVKRRSISQWFIRSVEMAREARRVVEENSIEVIPHGYKNSWSSWLELTEDEDWCISRQSWWGHRIPAYKRVSDPDQDGSWIVADSEAEAMKLLGCNSAFEIEQDPDVLDTWFSSSLLPLTISGWPHLDKFSESCRNGSFPLPIMETGFDILTFWVSKMAMISLALTQQIPFKLILLHGMICDSEGKKMSKSSGNVIDPLDVIDGASLECLQDRCLEASAQGILEPSRLESILTDKQRLFPRGIPQCGADGLRGYLLSHDVLEEVVRIQIDQIDKIRRFSNKVWNVFRFTMQIYNNSEKHILSEKYLDTDALDLNSLDDSDKNVLGDLAECVTTSHRAFEETYRLHHSFLALESFWFTDLSHDYMEESKEILLDKQQLCKSGDNKSKRELKIRILLICVETSLRLLHPFMPHVTEFLYHELMFNNGSLKKYDDLGLSSGKISPQMLLSYQPYPSLSDWHRFSSDTRRSKQQSTAE